MAEGNINRTAYIETGDFNLVIPRLTFTKKYGIYKKIGNIVFAEFGFVVTDTQNNNDFCYVKTNSPQPKTGIWGEWSSSNSHYGILQNAVGTATTTLPQGGNMWFTETGSEMNLGQLVLNHNVDIKLVYCVE